MKYSEYMLLYLSLLTQTWTCFQTSKLSSSQGNADVQVLAIFFLRNSVKLLIYIVMFKIVNSNVMCYFMRGYEIGYTK